MSVPADQTNTISEEENNIDTAEIEKVPEESPIVKKKVYEADFRLAVFDDGEQVHCIWTPFLNVSDGFVTYREPATADQIPKEDQIEMMGALPIIRCEKPEMLTRLRWIRCHADMRKDLVYLDLESNSDRHFGKVTLGKGTRKTGDYLTQTDEDGVTIKYSLSYNKSYGIAGESCFCLHEITVPLSRLRRGVSNSNF